MLRRSLICVCLCSRRLTLTSERNVIKRASTGYKSQYNISQIYPNSDQDHLSTASLARSTSSPDGKELFTGYIPITKLDVKYLRGSGPGGQNVNKVSTKVEVRFHVESAEWIPEWIRQRVIENEQGRMNKEGYLIVTSDATRKQLLNQADCLEKIRTIIFSSSRLPREVTEEEKAVKEKRVKKAKQTILREKRAHSLKKQSRQTPGIGGL